MIGLGKIAKSAGRRANIQQYTIETQNIKAHNEVYVNTKVVKKTKPDYAWALAEPL